MGQIRQIDKRKFQKEISPVTGKTVSEEWEAFKNSEPFLRKFREDVLKQDITIDYDFSLSDNNRFQYDLEEVFFDYDEDELATILYSQFTILFNELMLNSSQGGHIIQKYLQQKKPLSKLKRM